ncbi:unnamed protein product [Chironomus riparius]|uniref:Guanylate-binding protein N-terminal domain-containing protein n=1 Tax=Chironomus riparius TaxID=315576 RepID=A0A9N9RRJ7_9DIPT|nr:unnamed protein product [Chironomus riparius]
MSTDHDHPYGKPITVMKFSDTGEVVVDNEEVDKIFNHPEIEDRKIVILSLIGAFRGGKSFLLNYCLRFLYANYSSINDPKIADGEFLFEKDKNWMGICDEALKGFSWRSGIKRDTVGIIIWSDVFLHTIDKTGEKIAIFVMDTQGLFDKHSSPTDNSRIFVLSNLISSIQVLNLANRIQEDQLQYLQFTTEFAAFALENTIENVGKPFQNLMFLIRDWNNGDYYNYGTVGGRSYLEEVMKVKTNQKPELQSVRKTIASCFDEITCCLLPNPGKGVSRGKNYNGSWSEMDEDFKEELQSLVESLLLPDNLIKKKINSMDLNVKEMKQYIQHYLKLFQTNQIPKVSSIYELTVERFMNNMIDQCVEDYKLSIYRNEDIINEDNIVEIHNKCKERTLTMYDDEKKMGNLGHAITFRSKLEEDIEKYFVEYRDQKEENLEKLKEARAKFEEIVKKDSIRKEEILKNIDKVQIQLKELSKKRKENPFLTEVYDTQEKVLKSRLEHEENELKSIERKEQREMVFRIVILGIAGISIPFSAISAAGVVAAGASQLTALTALGFSLDTFNIVSTTASCIKVVKDLFKRRKK